LLLPTSHYYPRSTDLKPPSRIIVVGYSNIPFEKDANAYTISENTSFQYTVETYNFDTQKPAMGMIILDIPDNWEIDSSKYNVQVAPMGRNVTQFKITPKSIKPGTMNLFVHGNFGIESVAPSASYFKSDLAAIRPIQKKSVNWGATTTWIPECSVNGTANLEFAAPDIIRISADFTQKGDRWAYPVLKFAQPNDLSGYDGISFNLESDIEDINTRVGFMVIEPNGSHYFSQTPLVFGKRRLIFLFKDMRWGNFSLSDNNSQLDLNQISAIKLGLNTQRNEAHFEASHFELVKY
jgi:hypothetical protein